ncbi:Uncharacterized protein NEOC65_001788 [Neochlamydia sp. AcF65]|uniref:hypothetical protein n=1 Tax=Neochlamydia sp. AcF65 TaxID=2795735 RepID=UPI001BC91BB3|nr:hypothetical protein [Neochlamydia sp. AcF65]MBS4166695.1 Uncharacterized protein [Neochlamydia sp. AcF65]MBS4171515.1 Uncharacterized protein [Neochlamydia sp. AcF95]
MASLKSEYLSLIAQMQSYLIQEFPSKTFLEVSRSSYMDYRLFAASCLPQTIKKVLPPQFSEASKVEDSSVVAAPLSSTVVTHASTVVTHEKHPKDTLEVLSANSKSNLASEQALSSSSPDSAGFVPKAINLEFLAPALPPSDFSDFHKIFAERFPEQMILTEIPNDEAAKNVRQMWKNGPQACLLLVLKNASSEPRHVLFLANLRKAIQIVYGVAVKIIEKNCLDSSQKTCIIELAPLDIYLQEPHRKVELWNSISLQLSK